MSIFFVSIVSQPLHKCLMFFSLFVFVAILDTFLNFFLSREAIKALKRSIERWRWPLSIGAGHPLLKMLN